MTQPSDTIEDKAGTIGPPMPGVEIKIIDVESGDTVPIGEVGEYCTRGYHVMTGYFEMPERTAEAIDDDGWLHTGDLCAMDERGYCTVEGRLKDMIIRGGENIYPGIELGIAEKSIPFRTVFKPKRLTSFFTCIMCLSFLVSRL